MIGKSHAGSPFETAKLVRAWESGDAEALVVVLIGDVIMSMLPISLKCHGRDVVAASAPVSRAADRVTSCRRGRMVSRVRILPSGVGTSGPVFRSFASPSVPSSRHWRPT